MHAISGSWTGKAFALATSNDSAGKKSRIRRSKEERKTMVESFIKKYQKSNDGSFPSLNLTHKEVGGSFYTVREIVREIIQENRVLAPPKVSPEDEHNNFEFLEQYPLGSISMEPQFESFLSDNVHMGTRVLTREYETSSEENISGSTKQLNGSSFLLESENGQSKSHQDHYYLKNNDEKIVNGIEEKSHCDNQQENNEDILSGQETANKNEEFEGSFYTKSAVSEVLDEENYEAQDAEAYENDEKIVNGIEENSHFDNRQDNNEKAILSGQETANKKEEFEESFYTKSALTEVLYEEKYEAQDADAYENDEKIVDGIEENSHFDNRQDNSEKAILSGQYTANQKEEFEESLYTKSAVTEVLDEEKYEPQDAEAYETAKCRVNSNNVVVETFPLRPMLNRIYKVDGKSGDLKEEDGTLEVIQKSSGFDDDTAEEKITDVEKTVVNVQSSSLESYEYSSASESLVLDMDHNVDINAENSPLIGAKAISSTEHLISEEPITVVMKSSTQDSNSDKSKNSLPKENKPMLDRINLETWEVTPKKSTQPENNPILALVKAFISSFVKFWTE